MNVVCKDCGFAKEENSQYCCYCENNTESIDSDSVLLEKIVSAVLTKDGRCNNCGRSINTGAGMMYGLDGGKIACSVKCIESLIASQCEPVIDKLKSNSDGSKNDYYSFFDGCVDVDDVAQKHGMTFAEGNILKALVGIVNERNGKGTRHGADSTERACNKIVHYANKIKG